MSVLSVTKCIEDIKKDGGEYYDTCILVFNERSQTYGYVARYYRKYIPVVPVNGFTPLEGEIDLCHIYRKLTSNRWVFIAVPVCVLGRLKQNGRR